MRANGWDGVFVDDTNASQSWHLCGRTIAKYPTDAAYAAATRSFLANVGPALTSQGFLVIPNIYLPYSSSALSTWLDWISFTSGGMQEFWSKWGTTSTGHFGGADWTYRQQFLGATQKAGKIFLGLSYAPNADVRSMRYARSTFLLDWDGGASAVLFEGESGGDPTNADWMTDIGTPRGARYPVGAAWRRDYSGGTVLVNPSSTTVWVTLGSPHVNGEGQVVTSLALAPTNGVVLKSVGATAPPAPRLRPRSRSASRAPRFAGSAPTSTGAACARARRSTSSATAPGSPRRFTYSSYPDRFGRQVRGKYTWQVCLAGTRSCSNTLSLTF